MNDTDETTQPPGSDDGPTDEQFQAMIRDTIERVLQRHHGLFSDLADTADDLHRVARMVEIVGKAVKVGAAAYDFEQPWESTGTATLPLPPRVMDVLERGPERIREILAVVDASAAALARYDHMFVGRAHTSGWGEILHEVVTAHQEAGAADADETEDEAEDEATGDHH